MARVTVHRRLPGASSAWAIALVAAILTVGPAAGAPVLAGAPAAKAAGPASPPATPAGRDAVPPPPPGWKTLFEDGFNGPAASKVGAKWIYDTVAYVAAYVTRR
jgi:hypothetical protein